MASTAGPAAALSAVEGETAAPADLLAIILDVNPLAWHACGIETRSSGQDGKEIVDSLSFEDAVRSMLVLANAHMALRFENHLVIYAAGLGQSTLLYSSIHAQRKATHKSSGAVQPSPDLQLEGAAAADSNSYQTFRILDEAVVHSLRELYPAVEQDSTENVHSGQCGWSSKDYGV
ncbi:RNA polymerase II transcription factor B subunit 4 [Cystobasidiomycetes sp. EMM_F5]